jgi:hypothetical protein
MQKLSMVSLLQMSLHIEKHELSNSKITTFDEKPVFNDTQHP